MVWHATNTLSQKYLILNTDKNKLFIQNWSSFGSNEKELEKNESIYRQFGHRSSTFLPISNLGKAMFGHDKKTLALLAMVWNDWIFENTCAGVRIVNDQISSYLASCYALFKIHLSSSATTSSSSWGHLITPSWQFQQIVSLVKQNTKIVWIFLKLMWK